MRLNNFNRRNSGHSAGFLFLRLEKTVAYEQGVRRHFFLTLLRYSSGAVPVYLLKYLAKYDWSGKCSI